MPEGFTPEDADKFPEPAEFEVWEPEKLRPLVRDKSVVFSPGGSSRWYFLEHADANVGYADADQFLDYARRGLHRTLDITNMMFADGIRTVFVVGVMPGQSRRGVAYARNLAKALELMADQTTQALYEECEIGVLFRGGWQVVFEELGAADLLGRCEDLERRIAPHRERWLIWLTRDDPIPRSLAPFLANSLQATGELPDRAALCQAYYGRALHHVDIFIGHNKLSVKDQLPPLVTAGDLYFTVCPSYYMDRQQWRLILYDHLFARRGHYRDYTALGPEVQEDLRTFYMSNRGVTLGIGAHHAPSQTWRPTLPATSR